MEDVSVPNSTEISKKLQPSISERSKFVASTILHSILSAIGLSTDPILSVSSAMTVFSNIVGYPIGSRWLDIIIQIAEGLEKLEKEVKSFKIDNLKDNQLFITTVLQVSQIAIRNHQKEKLNLLRNAALNTALGRGLGEEQQLTFLRYVDELTPLHVRILEFFQTNKQQLEDIKKQVKYEDHEKDNSENPLIAYFETSIPEIKGKHNRYLRDLMNRGLVMWHPMRTGIDLANIMISGYLSEEGKSFLQYIKSPITN